MTTTQQLALSQIDVRLSKLRLTDPREERRLLSSVQSEGRIREPLLVSAAVEEAHWVLVDGFKRLRVAQEMGLTHVSVQAEQLDGVQAKVAMLLRNQARRGLSGMEEAWIVRSLRRDHGLKQTEIAKLLKHSQSWVSRRLELLEDLDESLQDDVRLGLLPVTTARELGSMPRGIQVQAVQAVHEHQLTSRQGARLAQRLKNTHDRQAVREVLDDPLRYLAVKDNVRRGTRDPRLSDKGNRLRQSLMDWEGFCDRTTRELLSHQDCGELQVLLPMLEDAQRAGKRVMLQLDALHSLCSEQQPVSQPHQPGPERTTSNV